MGIHQENSGHKNRQDPAGPQTFSERFFRLLDENKVLLLANMSFLFFYLPEKKKSESDS